jgi:hypothetical protein
MVSKTGFDPVASCTPSTRSAWLSYVPLKIIARAKRASASKEGIRMLSILYRTGRRNGGGGRIFTCITEFAYNPTTVGSGYPSKMGALDVFTGP